MNDHTLALFINATFMPFTMFIAGAVTAITLMIVMYILFSLTLPED